MREKNHYKTLGIPADAGEAQIRGAYRALAKKYHPDTGEGSSADKFRDVQGKLHLDSWHDLLALLFDL